MDNLCVRKKEERTLYATECGERLRRTRVALGYTQLRKFAHSTHESEDNLGAWERGASLVPPLYVRHIKELFGVTFDWIYDGDAKHLAYDLTVKLLHPDNSKAD